MYDRPRNRAAHDTLWALIRDGLRAHAIAAPDQLNRATSHVDGWARDDLVLGQICNLPLRRLFWNKVTIIGASDYGLTGCPPGTYRSYFIVHRDCDASIILGARNQRFAYNEKLSWSGYGAPQTWATRRGGPFKNLIETGSHDASLAYIAKGQADLAAIDAQTWGLQCRDMSLITQVKIVGHTDTSPGQTLITRKGQNAQVFRQVISDAINALPDPHRHNLGLRGIIALPENDYDLPKPPNFKAIQVDGASLTQEALQNLSFSGLVPRN